MFLKHGSSIVILHPDKGYGVAVLNRARHDNVIKGITSDKQIKELMPNVTLNWDVKLQITLPSSKNDKHVWPKSCGGGG